MNNSVNLFIDENQIYTQIQKEQFKENFKKALGIALEIHKDQKPRPDGSYINHILRVSNRIVEEYGVKDPELIISALLHDSVEDQSKKMSNTIPLDINTSEQKRALLFIKNTFGDRVAKIIFKLSNPEEIEKEGLSLDERNKIYKDHIEEAINDPDVFLIKLADFSDNTLNLESITDPIRRLKLSKKYLPVVEVFISKIDKVQNILKPEKITEIKSSLLSTSENIKSFIKTQENLTK